MDAMCATFSAAHRRHEHRIRYAKTENSASSSPGTPGSVHSRTVDEMGPLAAAVAQRALLAMRAPGPISSVASETTCPSSSSCNGCGRRRAPRYRVTYVHTCTYTHMRVCTCILVNMCV